MGARYSDRFFGPDAPRGGPPGAGDQDAVPLSGRPAGPASVGREELDLVGGSQPAYKETDQFDPPPGRAIDRPWHAQPLARAALVVALLVGAVGGAYGSERWRVHQAEVAAQGVVEMTSEAFLLDVDHGPERNLSMSVRLENTGAYPITLLGFSPVDLRMAASDPDIEPVELSPSEDFVEVMHFGVHCEADTSGTGITNNMAVVAEVQTLSGDKHVETVPTTGIASSLGSFLQDQCSYPEVGFPDIYPEVVTVQQVGTDVVAAQVVLHSYSDAELPLVESLSTPSDAFTATLEGSLGDTPASGVRLITARWSVLDCAEALTAGEQDMRFEVRGRLPTEDAISTTTGYPTPDLVAELVRLSERVC